AEPFLPRAEADDVGRGKERIGVVSITGEMHLSLDSKLAGFLRRRGAQRAFSDEQRMGVWHSVDHGAHRPDEIHRVFVPDELGDLNDERRPRRHAELTKRGW